MREETTRRQQRAASMVRAQQLTQESHFSNLDYFITSETGSSPATSPWRKSKETLISMEHGTYIAVEPGLAGPGEKVAGGDQEEEDEECMDWWTKYHASLDTMIEVRQSIASDLHQTPLQHDALHQPLIAVTSPLFIFIFTTITFIQFNFPHGTFLSFTPRSIPLWT